MTHEVQHPRRVGPSRRFDVTSHLSFESEIIAARSIFGHRIPTVRSTVADAKGFAVRLGTMITWCMQVIIKSLRLDGESAGPPIPMSIVSRMSTTR